MKIVQIHVCSNVFRVVFSYVAVIIGVLFVLPVYAQISQPTVFAPEVQPISLPVTTLAAGESPEVKELLKSAAQTAKQMESEVGLKINLLKQDAQSYYQKIKLETEKQISDLKKSASQEMEKIKESTDNHSKIILDEASNEIEEINKKIGEETKEMRAQAASKVLDIVDEAEKKAVALKRKTREEAILKNIDEGRPMLSFDITPGTAPALKPWQKPINVQWKQSFFNEFQNSLRFMQQIIRDAETPQVIADFEKNFSGQLSWLDTTLTNTNYENDENYNKLTRKKSALDKVISNQGRADALLVSVYMNNGTLLQEQDRKALRLMTLYEVNALVNQKANNNVIAMGYVDLSENEIKLAINQAVKDFSLKTKKEIKLPPQVALPVIQDRVVPQQLVAIGRIQQPALAVAGATVKANLKDQLEDALNKKLNFEIEQKKAIVDSQKYKRDLEAANALLRDATLAKGRMSQQLEDTNKNLFNTEINLAKSQRAVEVAAKDSYEQAKDKFKPILEEQDRINTDLSIKLVGSKQAQEKLAEQNTFLDQTLTTTEIKMKFAQEQVAQAMQKVQEQEKLVKSLELKGALIQEVVVQKENELTQYSEALQNVKRRLSVKVADFAAEKRAWLLEKNYAETTKMIADEVASLNNKKQEFDQQKLNIQKKPEMNLSSVAADQDQKELLRFQQEEKTKKDLEAELKNKGMTSSINLISSK